MCTIYVYSKAMQGFARPLAHAVKVIRQKSRRETFFMEQNTEGILFSSQMVNGPKDIFLSLTFCFNFNFYKMNLEMINTLRTLFICHKQFGSNFRRLRPQGRSQTTLTRGGGQVVPKYQSFTNTYQVENVNAGRQMSKKKSKSCQCSL